MAKKICDFCGKEIEGEMSFSGKVISFLLTVTLSDNADSSIVISCFGIIKKPFVT